MSSPFAITAATNAVSMDSNRQGQTTFTVSNTTAQAIRGRGHVVPQPATAGSWLTLLGEAERNFAASGSQQYTVQIAVPPNAPAGDYTFQLDEVDVANPDDNFSEGPTVKFVVVPAPPPVKKPFPWWIVAVAVGALIILGGGIYGIVLLTHKAPATTPKAIVTPTATLRPPTPTPTPPFGLGTWSGVFTASNGGFSYQALLGVNTLQNGIFGGTMSQHLFEGNSIVSVSGTEGSLNQFNATSQSRLQFAIQLYGNGSGTFVEFTDPSRIQNNKGNGTGCVGTLNCLFDAVVYPDGSLHGVWFYPGDTQPDGTFVLKK